ncbi:hypothetical protein K432DRAFT_292428 [Lepidopterella palustris CBS 459.81]|uniref:Ornithine decarboxylase antizyme n=1 Tax=Lepidopterella palustris CBS 459.81 TaxID=1314670 RepID=A0A8E2EFE5_9PEZI|nr:hypothetical protein K432DRAFT_292428 [Lepidopterella palustris CBS 459.81]
MPSPPLSPPLAAYNSQVTKISVSDIPSRCGRARRGGAAYTITEECERLFCERMRAVFLGEGNLVNQDSLVAGMQNYRDNNINYYDYDSKSDGAYEDRIRGFPPPELDGFVEKRGLVKEWIEMFDYVGGARFRGFVTENDGKKDMFVFFDNGVVGSDLKSGLIALLELCDTPHFSCSRLIVCLDRHTESSAMKALTRDLGWVGFGITTLDDWTRGDEITSDSWVFMSMDV